MTDCIAENLSSDKGWLWTVRLPLQEGQKVSLSCAHDVIDAGT
jgi:hypothetical protein